MKFTNTIKACKQDRMNFKWQSIICNGIPTERSWETFAVTMQKINDDLPREDQYHTWKEDHGHFVVYPKENPQESASKLKLQHFNNGRTCPVKLLDCVINGKD